jgi:amino acid adenylation domain-containing protein
MNFTNEENLLLSSSGFVKQREYWLNKLSGYTDRTEFPSGGSKKTRSELDKGEVIIDIPPAVSLELIKLGKGSNLSIYIFLLSVLKTLIHRYTSREDIAVVSPLNRQTVSEMTVNRCVLIRERMTGGMTFKDLVLRVRQSVLEAYENQDYPLTSLVRQIWALPDDSRDAERILSTVVCALTPLHDHGNVKELDGRLIFSFNRGEDVVTGSITYDLNVYEKDFIRQVSRHVENILERALKDINTKISGITFLTKAERERLLLEFNDTDREFPGDMTIHGLIEMQAQQTPDRGAVVFEDHCITYRHLAERASGLAAALREYGTGPDSIAALLMERSLEIMIGILGILKAGGAYMFIDPDYPRDRINYMLKDSKAKNLLASSAVQVKEESIEGIDIFKGISFSTSTLTSTCKVSPTNLAYVVYTSGSTGQPKGVLVEHRSVIRLVKDTDYVEFKEGDRILQTGALEFDASTFEIWGALLNGLTLYLLKKEKLISAEGLKGALTRYDIATAWMTSPWFNRVSQVDIEVFGGLKNLLVGGDVLSPFHINRVKQRYPGLNIINGYGPTENTTFSAVFLIDREYRDRIPIGKPITNSAAYILDKYGHLQPVNVPGELWVCGEGVARGYLNDPELTAEKFDHDLRNYQDEKKNRTGKKENYQKFLRGSRGALDSAVLKMSMESASCLKHHTPSLLCKLPGGNIEFLGRMDHQVKIRGFRIEPGEIENCLLKHENIKEALVVVREDKNREKYLCAYVVAGEVCEEISAPGLREFLSNRLPGYMIPAYFTQVEAIPLTANGKVDRRALPEPGIGKTGPYAAPANEVERKVVEVWSDILGIEKEAISAEANFFELGGHSLKATEVCTHLHKLLGVKIPLKEIFQNPTVRELAVVITGVEKEKWTAIGPVEKKDYYPLSSAQKRLYFLQELETENIAYNMPYFLQPGEDILIHRLEHIFKQLIARHESLRTSFHMLGEEPVQRIHDNVEFQIDYYDLALEESHHSSFIIHHFVQRLIRPFDLAKAPLLRMGYVKTPGNQDLLLIDMHHIITDGTSQEILAKEFKVLYKGEELQSLKLQYRDFLESPGG